MKQDLLAYVKATEAKTTLTTILSLAGDKNIIKKLNESELNSFVAHMQEVLHDYNSFKNNEGDAKALVYILGLYMSKMVEDYLTSNGRL